MSKTNSSQVADNLLKKLSAEFKSDPTSGSAMLVDLLTVERLHARHIVSTGLKYSLILNIFLVVLVAYLAFPKIKFVVAQQKLNGSLAQIATADKPYYDLEDIKAFAQKRAVKVHNWDYGNYQQKFEDERPFWDEEPLELYVSTLFDSGVFESAEQFRRRFTAVIPSPATVKQQIKYDGEYRIYRVEMTLVDESVDLEGVVSKEWNISMDVREVLPAEGWAGLKVSRYVEAIKQ